MTVPSLKGLLMEVCVCGGGGGGDAGNGQGRVGGGVAGLYRGERGITGHKGYIDDQ